MSKKMFFTILVCCIVFVTSCTNVFSPAIPPDFNKAMSFSASITYGKFETAGSFSRNAEGKWEIQISAPEQVRGLSVVYEKGKTTVTMAGLAFDFEESELPLKTICSYMTDSIENLGVSESITAREADGYVKYSGTIPESGFIITWHKETSMITQIECGGVKADITGFKFT